MERKWARRPANVASERWRAPPLDSQSTRINQLKGKEREGGDLLGRRQGQQRKVLGQVSVVHVETLVEENGQAVLPFEHLRRWSVCKEGEREREREARGRVEPLTGEGVFQAQVVAGEEILLVQLVVRLGGSAAMIAGEDRPEMDVLQRHGHRRTIPATKDKLEGEGEGARGRTRDGERPAGHD